jgi:transposase
MAMELADEQLDWIRERVPDAPRSPLGARPPTDKRKAVAGIFLIMDNGAKWKDLPREFGSKSALHRYFKRWVEPGVFEAIMRAGRLLGERGQ